MATILQYDDLSRLDALFEQLLISDVRGRLCDWQVVDEELTATLRTLRGEAPGEGGPSIDVDQAERSALRFAGSRGYLGEREFQAEVRRRMEHWSSLSSAASEALRSHLSEFERLSRSAGGIQIGIAGLGALSPEWLGTDIILAGVGRYGQDGRASPPQRRVQAPRRL